MMYTTLQLTLRNKIESFVNDNKYWYDDVEVVEDEFGLGIPHVIVYGVHGDWKHDHLSLTYMLKDWFSQNNYNVISSNEDVTDSDGSDCYTANHHYYIVKES